MIISVILLPLYLSFFQEQSILGIWYTILSVLNWIVFFDLGLGQGLRNQLPKAIINKDKALEKKLISTTYFIMIGVIVILCVVGFVVIPKVNLYGIFNIDNTLISYNVLERSVEIVFVGIMAQLVLKIVTFILFAMQKSAVVNFLALITNVIILLCLLIVPSRDIESNLITMSWINVVAVNVPYIVCTILIFTKGELKGAGPSLKAFSKKYVKQIFNVGISLLWLQIVFMIVSSTNEFLISYLTELRYVVEYQAYYQVFKTAAIVVALALTPIWSAVTKAQIEKNYKWIKKVYYVFLGISALCLLGEICLIPILQWGMNIWLGENTIIVKPIFAVIFALSSTLFVLHNVNTSIGNGLSFFKVQMIWMTVAAVVFIPCAALFVQVFHSWIGVVFASIVAMLPYEVLSPIFTLRYLNNLDQCSKKENVG